MLPSETTTRSRRTPTRFTRTLTLFVSAIFAGALITATTCSFESQLSMIVRVVVAWVAGALLALGSFDHVIVVTSS